MTNCTQFTFATDYEKKKKKRFLSAENITFTWLMDPGITLMKKLISQPGQAGFQALPVENRRVNKPALQG